MTSLSRQRGTGNGIHDNNLTLITTPSSHTTTWAPLPYGQLPRHPLCQLSTIHPHPHALKPLLPLPISHSIAPIPVRPSPPVRKKPKDQNANMPQPGPPTEKYYRERQPQPPPPRQHNHRKNSPSFSSSLLDAITRSLDDSDSGTTGDRRRHSAGGAPHPTPPATRRQYYSTTSSTTSSSSSYGFSSSDTDTPIRVRPIRTGPVLTRSDRIRSDPALEKPNQTKKQNRNQNLTSIKKKLRELRRSAGPASPGAKLAGFLNSLFHPTAGNPKKPKIAKEQPSSAGSSCSRSCLSKTPSTRGSTGGKRSVRFCPVGVIVGEDCRPCGEKFVFSGGGGGFPTAEVPAPARNVVVEELMRGIVMEEDYESDSSEDLFELENLGCVGNTGKYRDELPVYETTSLGINRAIARGRGVMV